MTTKASPTRASTAALLSLLCVCGACLRRAPGAEDTAPPGAGESGTVSDVPWDYDSPPRQFAEDCWEDFRSCEKDLTEAEFRQFFEPVAGHALESETTSNTHGSAVTFTGFTRLRAPWVPDAVLRWSFHSSQPLGVHLWNGKRGISFWYYRSGNRESWAAYQTTCRPGHPLVIDCQSLRVNDPELALLATDDGRSGHAVAGTFAVRHQHGSLVLTKGDVQLLNVPLADMPREVYIQGNAALVRHLALYRATPVPDELPPERKIVILGRFPSSFVWEEHLPAGAEFVRHRDGLVQLRSTETDAPAWVAVPLIRSGLYEVVLEIENATPGAGIFLGNEHATPRQGVAYVRDPPTGRTGFALVNSDALPAAPAMDLKTAPAAWAPRRQWLKLVAAGGTLKCFSSGNGTHWGQPLAPLATADPVWDRLVLQLRPGRARRQIAVRRMQVRELDGITSLADAASLQQAADLRLLARLGGKFDFDLWQQLVWEHLPAGAEPLAWRRACAVAALVEGPPPALTAALLDALLRDGLTSSLPLDRQLRLLKDAGLVYPTTVAADAQRLATHYETLAARLLREGDMDGFERVRVAKMTIPLWTTGHGIDPISAPLARAALVRLASADRWDDVDRLCRQLRFWNQSSQLTATWPGSQTPLLALIDWGQDPRISFATRSVAGISVLKDDFRHPLVVELGKEAFNTQTELQGDLSEQSYEHAGRMVTSVLTARTPGLVPDRRDPRRFVSLPTAISVALRDDRTLRQVVNEQHGPGGLVRVKSAGDRGDEATVREATIAFQGTAAAGLAHRWLGDRLLSQGLCARALSEYDRAWPLVEPAEQQRISWRRRLAGAMLGRPIGQPVTAGIQYGNHQLTAVEFERLVSEMLEIHGSLTTDAAAARVPPPAAYDVRPWHAFEGDGGTDPEKVPGPSQQLDWAGRQLAVTNTANLMVVANRFHITALQLSDGQVKWSYGLSDRQGPTHAWPLVPMTPAIVAERLYARMLPAAGRPELVALDVASGQPLWTATPAAQIASDPFVMDGQLFAVCATPGQRGTNWYLKLVEFDAQSGASLREATLVELRHWTPEMACQATVAAGDIVVALSGGVLRCDVSGRLRWVRQSFWIPEPLDPNPGRQYHRPPLVSGDRVFVTEPGMRTVECLDLQTGELRWQLALPRVSRLRGVTGDHLLIETSDGILAAGIRDGKIAWRHTNENILDCWPPTEDTNRFLILRSEPCRAGARLPVLLWLDVQTGNVAARWPLYGLQGPAPRVGPVLAHNDQTWCFCGVFDEKGLLLPQRNIVQLVSREGSVSVTARPLDNSWAAVDPALEGAARNVLPDWTLLAGSADEQTGLQPEYGGRQNVLVTRAAASPTRFATRVQVPAAGRPRLVVEVGRDPAEESRLDIRVDGLTVRQHPLTAAGTTDPWRHVEVDLSAYSNRTVTLTIVHETIGSQPAYAYWKQIRLTDDGETSG